MYKYKFVKSMYIKQKNNYSFWVILCKKMTCKECVFGLINTKQYYIEI